MIHVLPEHIANKIAAGEVVERPASIVKELVENALDAEARRIDVSIQHGGKSLIRIADDGCGMTREEVALAFQRHATSKITSAEDLECITSYGFRGEALPSIGAVSRVRVRTRARGASSGTELILEGGHVQKHDDCSCQEGTIIEVRDLFFNTPARRKFMRTDGTERGHIMDVVGNVALAQTELHISLQSGDKKIWNFVPGEGALARTAIVFGLQEVGDLLALEGGTEGRRDGEKERGISISGMIGKPQIARANRSSQVFFVNGRPVKALGLSYALLDGYRGLLMNGQYPLAVIFIKIDPKEVDVNVHPTKQEVRLAQEREIKGLLKRAVAEHLAGEGDLAPYLQMKAVEGFQSRGVEEPGIGGGVEESGSRGATSFIGKMPNSSTPLPLHPSTPPPISLRNKLHITKILGQIHQTYIAAETEEGFVLIDQHAAHERVQFEALLTGLKSGQPERQGLLLNEVLEVRAKQKEIFDECQPLLEKIGFELEPFGESEYVIRSVPATLHDTDPVACLKRFLDQKETGKILTELETHQEELAALVACKRRSVKAHDALTSEKMNALIEQLSQCDNPYNCPHGRPTLFQMSIDDLEKQFRRKV